MKIKEVATFEHGNATIIVYRPELDEKERAKREKAVVNALAQYGRAVEKSRREREERS